MNADEQALKDLMHATLDHLNDLAVEGIEKGIEKDNLYIYLRNPAKKEGLLRCILGPDYNAVALLIGMPL